MASLLESFRPSAHWLTKAILWCCHNCVRYPRFAPENLAANAAKVAKLAALAAERGVTAAQLSLAWVQSQGVDVVPIPGTTKIKHLDDNIAAGRVHLDESERAIVAAAVPHEEVAGARYAGLATFVDQLETK